MADFASFQPSSDIHICGICRSEFNNIYNFIDHKKHCTITQTEVVTVTHQHHAPKFIVHHDEGNSEQTHYDSDEVVGNVVLPNNVAGVMNYGHLLPPDIMCPDRSRQPSNASEGENVRLLYPSSTMTIPSQQPNVIHLSNLCYENIVQHPDTNNMVQGKVANASTLIQHSNLNSEQNYSGGYFEIRNSPSQSESTLVSSCLDTNALPSQPHKCVDSNNDDASLSDNTLDSPALCPEDLEVGQISEAMIGKLSQKFCPKVQSKLRNMIDNNSGKVGKLDPISTFTVKGKKSGGPMNDDINNTSNNIVTNLFPVSGTRMNSSSAPLVDINNDSKSSCIRGISFEMRDRLQGVSDELLEPLPANSRTRCENEVSSSNPIGFTRTLSEDAVEESPVIQDETQSMENRTKKSSSIYKAVFTSPSSGGHRLSVKIPEPNRIGSTHCSASQREFTERPVQDSFERSNSSTSYKNISKLAELSQNGATKDGSSVTPNYSVDYGGTETPANTVGASTDTTCHRQEIESVNLSQDPDCPTVDKPAVNVSNYLHDSDTHISDICSTGGNKLMDNRSNGNKLMDNRSNGNKLMDNRSNGNKAQDTRSDESVFKLSGLMDKTSTEHLSTSIATDMRCEPERNGVTATDQAESTPWSTIEVATTTTEDDDIGKESVSTSGEQGISDKEDTVVIVYKREDNSFIMMYKPKQLTNDDDEHFVCDRINEEVCLEEHVLSQHVIESVNKEIHRDEQEHQLHSVIQPAGQYYLSNSGHNQHRIMTEVGDQQTYLYSVGTKAEDVGFEHSVKKDKTSLPDREFRGGESEEKILYFQVPKVQNFVRNTGTKMANVNITQNVESRSRHMRTERKLKEPSLRAKQKNVKEYRLAAMNADVTITPNHPSTVANLEAEVKGRNKSFTCHFGNCSYSTSLGKDFQRHYRTHTGERPYRCDECGKTFNRSDKLKTHLRCHAGQKPFQCKICSYATVDSGSLKKHTRIHTDERPFQCQICPYASRNSSQLIVHLRTHTGDAPFHCNVCSAQFKIKSDLKRHLRVHTGEKPFECDKCDYKSSNKGNLKTHYKINHSLENEKSCPQCSFVTSSMKRLREHIKIHDEARIVKCRVCQYTCNSSTALRSHMMVHNSLRPFRCSFCPYSSKQSGNLKKHIQNIHQEKHRMVVTIGSKYASDKSHGRKRAKSRENETEYRPVRRSGSSRKIHTCDMCGCGFVRQDSLRCHLKQHKEKEPGYEERSNTEGPTGEVSQAPPQSTPPLPPPPPPPVVYRRQGLDHIVAAASQLYREQYMNGQECEEESPVNESDGSNLTPNEEIANTTGPIHPGTINIVDTQHNFSEQLSTLSQEDKTQIHLHDGNGQEHLMETSLESVPGNHGKVCQIHLHDGNGQEHLMETSLESVPGNHGKVGQIHLHDGNGQEHLMETSLESVPGNHGKVCQIHLHDGNGQEHLMETSLELVPCNHGKGCQIPWEQSCYTASSNKSWQPRTDATSGCNNKLSSPPIGKSLSSSSSLSPLQLSKSCSVSKSPSSQTHLYVAKSSNGFQTVVQQPSDLVRFEPQTVNIQLVSQIAPINSVSSQLAAGTAQNVLGPVSFPALPSGQPTFQILLPSGTHMAQIFPSQPAAMSHPSTIQPQIMFQVQGSVQTKQEIVTIPTAMDTSRGVNGLGALSTIWLPFCIGFQPSIQLCVTVMDFSLGQLVAL